MATTAATTAAATTAAATTAAATTAAATTAAPMIWETKSGKVKQAHSELGQALAPKAVRLERAQQTQLTQLMNGHYRPFLRDLQQLLGAKKSEKLAGFVSRQSVTPEGYVLQNPLVQPNKQALQSILDWLTDSENKPPKGAKPYAEVLWLWANPE